MQPPPPVVKCPFTTAGCLSLLVASCLEVEASLFPSLLCQKDLPRWRQRTPGPAVSPGFSSCQSWVYCKTCSHRAVSSPWSSSMRLLQLGVLPITVPWEPVKGLWLIHLHFSNYCWCSGCSLRQLKNELAWCWQETSYIFWEARLGKGPRLSQCLCFGKHLAWCLSEQMAAHWDRHVTANTTHADKATNSLQPMMPGDKSAICTCLQF